MIPRKRKPASARTKAAIQQPKRQTKSTEMEVHHHGHVHEKKKWKEYLFQFFMLFLAVFCGFLAEYKLEQTIERHREQEYAKAMINDLKTDTAHLNLLGRRYKLIVARQDTLMRSFKNITYGYSTDLQRLSQSIQGFPDFIYTDGTIQQLKNSGGFRLMRNRRVVDSILAYDADVKKTLINERVLGDELTQLVGIENDIYDYQKIDEAIWSGVTPAEMEASKLDVLATKDPVALGKFYRQIRYYNAMCTIVYGQLTALKEKATRLLHFIEKEYD